MSFGTSSKIVIELREIHTPKSSHLKPVPTANKDLGFLSVPVMQDLMH